MKITGLTLDQFDWCQAHVSGTRYAGNVLLHNSSHPKYEGGIPGCTARLAVLDSHGPGSRTSWRGRHGPYACWHAYRDVLAEVFTRYPEAVITAGHSWRVTYRGAQGFLDLYPGTGWINVGSQANLVTMPELCDCGGLGEFLAPARTEIPIPVLSNLEEYGDADYVSDAVMRASKQMARSQKLLSLSEKPLDPYVFGPEYRKEG